MALVLKDRVQETTTTTGQGTITLAGAVAGFQSFAAIGNANTTYYTIVGGTQWEMGIGTYTSSGTTLSRDTVISNSLGDTTKIDFTAGTKLVFCTYPAEKALYVDGSSVAAGSTATIPNSLTTATSANGASTIVARDASGNFSAATVTANLTGTASNATVLQTARAIYGNNFDGSAALTQVIASTYGGTGNGFTKFTGPTTAEKTFTLPDASATILTSNTAVTVAQGGTGATTLNANAVILGNTTSAVQFVAPGANGNVLTSNGTTWTSAAAASGYAGVRATTFTGNGTFTIPAGITQLKVTVVGGGGGGGVPTNQFGQNGVVGGGGGAGGLAVSYLTGLTPGNTLAVTIGAAGTGGATSTTSYGTAGGTSSVASGTQSISTISATGGAVGGSSYNVIYTPDGGLGGAGSGGTINSNGSPGFPGLAATYATAGGHGGSSVFGGGGRALGSGNGSGGNATGYGSGGAGATGNASYVGGNGSAGIVIFEY